MLGLHSAALKKQEYVVNLDVIVWIGGRNGEHLLHQNSEENI